MKMRIALPLVLLLSGCVHAQLSNQHYRSLKLTPTTASFPAFKITEPSSPPTACGSATKSLLIETNAGAAAGGGLLAVESSGCASGPGLLTTRAITAWADNTYDIGQTNDIYRDGFIGELYLGRNSATPSERQAGKLEIRGGTASAITATLTVADESAVDYLTLGDAHLQGASDNAYDLGRTGRFWRAAYINDVNVGQSLTFEGGSLDVVLTNESAGSDRILETNARIRPSGSSQELGESGARWSDVFAEHVDVAGNVAVTGNIGVGTGAGIGNIGFGGVIERLGTQLIGAQQPGVGGTADGTYDSVEQGMINDICEALATHGLIASCH